MRLGSLLLGDGSLCSLEAASGTCILMTRWYVQESVAMWRGSPRSEHKQAQFVLVWQVECHLPLICAYYKIAWSSGQYLPCFRPQISLASAARNPGEEAGAEPDRGPGASGALHASVVLSGCPLLQPGEEGAAKGAGAVIARFGYLQIPGVSELWRTGCPTSSYFMLGKALFLTLSCGVRCFY